MPPRGGGQLHVGRHPGDGQSDAPPYGIGFFIPLVPACFAAESGMGPGVRRVCLALAVLSLACLWLNISGLDPLRRVTQRLAIVLIMGSNSYASHQLLKASRSDAVAK